ncbi:MAG: hypothetical protein CFE23_14995 [Flavobacterium sp. BFFFF1]|uniref:TIGR03067 domain-containing protein n=1 Tax=Flavobacterium sp. BFFFF1 TaxID=2015557 RepID=UPI000BCD93A8|nr:TIGR03067 domain-containing protein [Flavobacterium sp. BFFFF1]OYU79232.1 MAG: hypothetical protein CFE23_14995 [Flavobacterium sp. BFFFF1]
MKLLTFIAFLTISLNGQLPISTKVQQQLDGTWLPIRQEINGEQIPDKFLSIQKLILSGNDFSMTAESTDKGKFDYEERKMDIYVKEGANAGKHFTAIYKLENDLLTICYNLGGDSYPEAFDTSNQPLFFMSVFKRSTE